MISRGDLLAAAFSLVTASCGQSAAAVDAGSSCLIDGVVYQDGTVGGQCRLCDATGNPTVWTNRPDGTRSGNMICFEGDWVQACLSNGMLYWPQTKYECFYCDGDGNINLPLPGPCADGGGYCDAGVCVPF
jgi:hypothetical protein